MSHRTPILPNATGRHGLPALAAPHRLVSVTLAAVLTLVIGCGDDSESPGAGGSTSAGGSGAATGTGAGGSGGAAGGHDCTGEMVTIADAAGSWSHGQEVTITGCNFSTDGDELPVKFDDFEGCDPGTDLGQRGWHVSAEGDTALPTCDTGQSYGQGTVSGHADMSGGGEAATFLRGQDAMAFYVSLWFYYFTDGAPATHKGVRVHADDGAHQYTAYPGVFMQDYAGPNARITVEPMNEASSPPVEWQSYSHSTVPQNGWHRLEYYFALSQSPGAADGAIRNWLDGTLEADAQGVTRGDGVTDHWQLVMLPFYYGNGGGGTVWYDDVYIAKSLAHLELCSGATWSSKDTCQVQLPTSWTDTRIVATVNQGGLSAGPLYVYVVASNGQANATGHQIDLQ